MILPLTENSFGAGDFFSAVLAIRRRAVTDNVLHSGQRFDVVHDRRLAQITLNGGKGRLQLGLAS